MFGLRLRLTRSKMHARHPHYVLRIHVHSHKVLESDAVCDGTNQITLGVPCAFVPTKIAMPRLQILLVIPIVKERVQFLHCVFFHCVFIL